LDRPGRDPARSRAVGCLLDRLVLPERAANEPKLAEARAELYRRGGGPDASANSITGAESPRLRGAFRFIVLDRNAGAPI